MPQNGIQGTAAANWIFPDVGSNVHHSPSDTTNTKVEITKAIRLA